MAHRGWKRLTEGRLCDEKLKTSQPGQRESLVNVKNLMALGCVTAQSFAVLRCTHSVKATILVLNSHAAPKILRFVLSTQYSVVEHKMY